MGEIFKSNLASPTFFSAQLSTSTWLGVENMSACILSEKRGQPLCGFVMEQQLVLAATSVSWVK